MSALDRPQSDLPQKGTKDAKAFCFAPSAPFSGYSSSGIVWSSLQTDE
jgi:hypothetical protein